MSVDVSAIKDWIKHEDAEVVDRVLWQLRMHALYECAGFADLTGTTEKPQTKAAREREVKEVRREAKKIFKDRQKTAQINAEVKKLQDEAA